jgi:hypothetical protein
MAPVRYLGIVVVVAGLLLLGTKNSQSSAIRGAGVSRSSQNPAAASVPWYRQLADDYTYQVALPGGWQRVGNATLDYGLFFSTQGESLAMGTEQVFMNRAMLNAQLPGYSYVIPRALLVLKSRMLSPPLAPLQVVTWLMPQIARGAIQNLRVRGTSTVGEDYGFRKMLVLYEYTFVPQRDPAFATQLHPALRTRPQVRMQGAALVITYPYLAGQATWTFGYLFLNAPYDVFQRNERVYPQILEGFQLIEAGMAQRVKSNEEAAKIAASMNDTMQQAAHGWWNLLGSEREAVGDFPGAERPLYHDAGCNQPYDQKYVCQTGSGQWVQACRAKSEARPPEGWQGLYRCQPQ